MEADQCEKAQQRSEMPTLPELKQLVENFDFEGEVAAREEANWPFADAETELMKTWIGVGGTGQQNFLNFITGLSSEPVKQARALLIFQKHCIKTEDFPDRLAILKNVIAICESNEQPDLMFDSLLAKETHALIALSHFHNFPQAKKFLTEILADIPQLDLVATSLDARKLSTLINLAMVESRLGNWQAASDYYCQAYEIFQANPGIDWSILLQMVAVTPRCYERAGSQDQAIAMADWLLRGFATAQENFQLRTSTEAAQPQELDKLEHLIAQTLEKNPAMFDSLKKDLEKVEAIAQARLGDSVELERLIATYEDQPDSSEKLDALGELYFELGKYLAEEYQKSQIQNHARDATGTTFSQEPLAPALLNDPATLREKYLAALASSIEKYDQARLDYHRGEVLIKRAYLETHEEDQINNDSLDDLNLGIGLLEQYLGIPIYHLLNTKDKEGQPNSLKNALQVIDQIYRLNDRTHNCAAFLHNHEHFQTKKTWMLIQAELKSRQIDQDGDLSFADILKVGGKIWDIESLHVLDGDREKFSSDPSVPFTVDQHSGLQNELVRYAKKVLGLENIQDYQQALDYFAQNGLVLELTNFYLAGKPTSEFPHAISSALLTFVDDKLIIAIRNPKQNNLLKPQEQIAFRVDLLGARSPSSPKMASGFCEEGDRDYAAAQDLAQRAFLATLEVEPITKGGIVYIKIPNKVEFGGYIEERNEIIASGSVSLMREQEDRMLFERYCSGINIYQNSNFDRNDCIYTGGLAIRSAYRRDCKVFMQLCREQVKYAKKHNCKYAIAIANKMAINLLRALDRKDPPLTKMVSVDQAAIERANLPKKFVEDWKKYYKLDPWIIRIDRDKIISDLEIALQSN